jgi:hypothetical protein
MDLAAAPAPSEDKLTVIRTMVREVRDLTFEVKSLEERIDEKNKRITHLRTKALVDMFMEAKISRLDIEPEGNMPGYTAESKPYYAANIAVDWEAERRQKAFDWLDANGHGDLIKTEIVVQLPRDQRRKAAQVERYLARYGYPSFRRLSVPWNTLTAWLREQVEKYQKTPPLDLFGATVGMTVNLKEKVKK